jgi:CubicO group peptidase (beta-lactamase class C family)
MKTRIFLSVFLALAILSGGCSPSQSRSISPSPAWPTGDWSTSSPEDQGMDSVLLAQMLEEVAVNQTRIHSVLVIRNGYLVTEAYFHPYTRDTKVHIQSVTKSVIGALVGIAIKNGSLKSVDEPLLSFFPGRVYANPGSEKDAIRLRHLLSMTSSFPCQEFSNSGQSMEQTSGWVQFMLDLPVTTPPGQTFGYCNGNAHLLSAIIEKSTDMSTREFANRELFEPLGIPAVDPENWWTDPQGFSAGGYGLFLRPIDLAKFAYLYLNNGQWNGQQILPDNWVTESTTSYVQKPEGPGYGYLWTVYSKAGRYSALGMAGQQIHVYPDKNLIVIVTAELETFVEAPEIERMLNDFILPAIKSDTPLAENPQGASRLQAALDVAAHPVQPVPELPAIAREISGKRYTFEANASGWQTMTLTFTPEASTAQVSLNDSPDFAIGLDNIYRSSDVPPVCPNCLLRGRWTNEQTFSVDLPTLGTGTTEVEMKFHADEVDIAIQPVIFGGQPLVLKGKTTP